MRIFDPHTGLFPPGIYIFAFHTVVDETNAVEWERMYRKGSISRKHFEEHIEFLMRHMSPLPLSETQDVIRDGQLDRPFFVVTFDDGYKDIIKNAAPVLKKHGIRPTVFVNGSFADGRVYYRVLAAILVASGYAGDLAKELKKRIPLYPWSDDPEELFNQPIEPAWARWRHCRCILTARISND